MALILPTAAAATTTTTTITADQTFADESSRRRSTFYVPLSTEDLTSRDHDDIKKSNDQMFNPNLSGYSYDWSINDSIDGDGSEILREKSSQLSVDDSNRLKRYGIVLNGSVNIDDSNLEVHANHKRSKTKNLTSSTPIKDSTKTTTTTTPKGNKNETAMTPQQREIAKEKSKTLPVKDTHHHQQQMTTVSSSIFPPKNSHILKSTPKISTTSINYNTSSLSDTSSLLPQTTKAIATPKKSLSFIRRTHSTKLSRNNSLLKSLTSKCVENSNENLPVNVYDLSVERLELYLKAENCDDLMKELFLREPLNTSSSDDGGGGCGSEKNKENNNNNNSSKHNNNNYDDDAMSGKQKKKPNLEK